MTGQYLANGAAFVIQTLFGLYILAVLLRFLFQLVKAPFRNPVSQFIVTITNPVLRHFRRFIPGYGGIDIASLVLMMTLQMLELLLISLLFGTPASAVGLFVLAVGKLLEMTIYIFMFAIFARIIISWVNPQLYNPMTLLLASMTDFMMQPARRLIPPIGMLDLSPMIVFLILGLVLRLIVQPILDIGARMLM
ncbi:MAG: YggT family protein [Gammaproteobacteria bacterium]|nr:YggT family protein [Gammaproteobacteria bacterium]MDX2488801.1 YggT family protein [Gammaproteobacteria bacterium]